MHSRAWWATVHGVTENQTQLSSEQTDRAEIYFLKVPASLNISPINSSVIRSDLPYSQN